MARRFTSLTLLASIGALAACEPDGSATLSLGIERPTLGVEATILTTELTGGFDLVLSLGEYAPEPATVRLGVFTLKRGEQVVTNLDIQTTPAFPVEVGVGETRRIEAVVMDSLKDPELATMLCQGELSFAGTLTDSLGDDRPRSVASDPFAPTCP